MKYRKKFHKKYYVILVILVLVVAVGLAFYLKNKKSDIQNNDSADTVKKETVNISKLEPDSKTEPVVTEWPITNTLKKAAELTVVVNKKHRLPSNYVPVLENVTGGKMRPEAANALKNLLSDAEKAGNPMVVASSYRSYDTQVSTYQYWVNTQGKAEADRESARPGHSEHQTGLAVDLGNPDGSCRLLACFGTGIAGKWLDNNAYKYGFIIRYPEGKESLTGYIYEPWHVRYVGIDQANAIKISGQTMDQYYGVEAGNY